MRINCCFSNISKSNLIAANLCFLIDLLPLIGSQQKTQIQEQRSFSIFLQRCLQQTFGGSCHSHKEKRTWISYQLECHTFHQRCVLCFKLLSVDAVLLLGMVFMDAVSFLRMLSTHVLLSLGMLFMNVVLFLGIMSVDSVLDFGCSLWLSHLLG